MKGDLVVYTPQAFKLNSTTVHENNPKEVVYSDFETHKYKLYSQAQRQEVDYVSENDLLLAPLVSQPISVDPSTLDSMASFLVSQESNGVSDQSKTQITKYFLINKDKLSHSILTKLADYHQKMLSGQQEDQFLEKAKKLSQDFKALSNHGLKLDQMKLKELEWMQEMIEFIKTDRSHTAVKIQDEYEKYQKEQKAAPEEKKEGKDEPKKEEKDDDKAGPEDVKVELKEEENA